MKKSMLFMAMVLFSGAIAFAQNNVAIGDGAVISVDKDIHDYGEIEKGGDPFCEFTITNDGNEPLFITNAKGSCGCTVPEWSKEPVLPGESTVMKVKYDTKRVGPINKSVTVTSNASNEPTKVLRIKGKVLAPDAGAGVPIKTVSPSTPVAK